ncbi:MAG: hypothetical protein IKU25_03035 [Clostridia bacterium]|nr:hypothetical protein [Clostridia bacterium]
MNTDSPLPKEYQRVEYIESTGTQYIDTNLPFQNYPGFKIKCKKTDTAGHVIFGAVGTATSTNAKFGVRLMLGQNVSSTQFQVVGYYGQLYSALYTSVEDWHDIELSSGLLVCDGVENSFTKVFNASTYNILLFGSNQFGTITPAKAKIDTFQVFWGQDSPEIARDFVPCYRKSDGVIGMYDLCGSICPLTETPFYINAGDGEFLKGDDI